MVGSDELGLVMDQEQASLSIRIDMPGAGRFGPGKAWLLEAIDIHGSITAAASQLEMSYPRALRLVNNMNSQFCDPLIETYQGGARRGGAALTPTGKHVLSLYKQISSQVSKESHTKLAELASLAE